MGVLQGLARRGIVKRLNYLSTVSGGGYIGGFWAAWRHRHAKSKQSDQRDKEHGFPMNSQRDNERPPIRHLRRLSNFLAPGPGLFAAEGGKLTLALLGFMVGL
ncbi:MAG: hypothetical protein ACPGVU_12210 [Limisphaerales bacterium]